MLMAKKHQILLVDDDGDLVEVQEILLVSRGYSVVGARSAEQAIEILKTGQKFDLLVTDVKLPKLDGWELADLARGFRPQLPVVFVTGLDANALSERPQLPPGMFIVRKAAPIEEFYAALDSALAISRAANRS